MNPRFIVLVCTPRILDQSITCGLYTRFKRHALFCAIKFFLGKKYRIVPLYSFNRNKFNYINDLIRKYINYDGINYYYTIKPI